MKIYNNSRAIFVKASSFYLLLSLAFGTPLLAQASFFSDITDMFLGTEANADEATSDLIQHNSQNIPLLEETSIDPNVKGSMEAEDIIVVQDDSFIYSNGPYTPDVKFERSPLSDKIFVYQVEEGDTLSQIAETFDVSVNTIRWENNISGQKISVGQKLNILPVTGVKHIVKSGDTISKIASKYEAETEDILIFNDLSKTDPLKQGDIIFVPNGIIKTVASTPSGTSKGGKTVSSNTKAPSGYYLRPVSGITTSPYGSRKAGFHYGIDIGNKRGTPVSAAASGVVVKVVRGCVEGKTNCGGRYGNYVVIQHSNGTKTFYAHLSSASVYVGDNVSQGEKIGALGNTGRSTGPHLHFEIENANGSKMRPTF